MYEATKYKKVNLEQRYDSTAKATKNQNKSEEFLKRLALNV